MDVTLRQLKALHHVVELGSFVAASRAMYVTPAALSILIAELERILGFRVLDRTTRQARLSAAGEQYFPFARRVLQDLDGARRCAQEVRSGQSGAVRIATSQVIAWTLMPPILSAFKALHPAIRLEPMDLPVDAILPSLESGQADLAITLRGASAPELDSLPAFSSRVHVACRADHRWHARRRLRWVDLVDEPLVFTGIDTPQRINAALADGPILQAAWQVDHTGSALALVASGFGSAVCAGYVRPMGSMHRLRMVPLVEPTVVRQFAIYSVRRRAQPPAVEGFREFLIKWFARAQGGFVEQLLDSA